MISRRALLGLLASVPIAGTAIARAAVRRPGTPFVAVEQSAWGEFCGPEVRAFPAGDMFNELTSLEGRMNSFAGFPPILGACTSQSET